MNINKKISEELKVKQSQVESAVKLLDEGNTVPFISRYRKEATGSLTDIQIREIFERLTYLRNLESRKDEVIRLIDEQGKLTEKLKGEILAADVLQRLEDLYRPFKKKKSTRASKAKENGLEPLANLIMAQEEKSTDFDSLAENYINDKVKTTKLAFKGACDIIAENISDNATYRKKIRELYMSSGVIKTVALDEKVESVYEMYYDFEEPLNKIANHRILAITRAEKEKILKVAINVNEMGILEYLYGEEKLNEEASTYSYYKEAISDSFKRLISPSIDREIRNNLFEIASEEAIKIFGVNTKNLLMVPPIKDRVVLAIDPSFRTGCKLAVLDGTGKLLDHTAIFPNAPRNEVEKSQKLMMNWIKKYGINLISIGNGTASRETEAVVSDMLSKMDEDVSYAIVSEAGASVYSASKLAQDEYPDLDVTVRGAISIGRRLQDPLSELVKIDPKSIGVGQYQHDVNQKKLSQELDGVIEDCVNSVGVDLNTASGALLNYVSGVNLKIAKNIVSYREENGKFKNRKQVKKVKMLGDKAFEQCAGFLRISDGENILDRTAVHPESYAIVEKLFKKLGYVDKDLQGGFLRTIKSDIIKLDIHDPKAKKEVKKESRRRSNRALKGFEALAVLKKDNGKKANISDKKNFDRKMELLANELDVGLPTLKDIVAELEKPGRDPRDEMPSQILRSDVLDIKDLKKGMRLKGTVRNVVDFGAFIDIGIKQDALVHISQISKKYIKHPLEILAVGDIIDAEIIDVDLKKGRVGLTMIFSDKNK